MRIKPGIWLITLLIFLFSGEAYGQSKSLNGYTSEQAAAQYELESRFDGLIQAGNLRDWLKRLAARPQHLGSPYRKDNAEFILSLFQKWGFDARIETFYVYFPTPKVRKLEMVAPTSFHAKLTAPPVEGDPVTAMQEEQLPSYNAYSIDGDVTGELVYANQGLHQDYAELERRGIDVQGKIVIVRYGGGYRGIKPKVAAEKGAIGCLIYSDPRDSGYGQGDVYPRGSFMPPDGVQRGSVLDITLYPGDPLTPFVGATLQAERIDPRDAPTLSRIPVFPLSYADAQPLLEAMTGPVAPPDWRGALPITYHLGPGEAEVHLKLEFDWKLTPAYNVIAKMEGSERPDEWIIRGNHSDGWVAGAADPLSGLIVLMEEARVMSELTRSGWRPNRTLVFCAWDAEEPGIIGSTEWVETHAAELKEKAAVYINTDSNGRGFLWGAGSPCLEEFFNQVARDVVDPQTGVSVAERAWASRAMRTGSAERSPIRLSALGSGSDFASFLQHLGVISLNVGYGGENRGGIGHSIYDTFPYYVRFGDPAFEYGVALAKTTGRIALRLANADILPFEFKDFVNRLSQFIKEIRELWERMRTETEQQNQLIAQKVFALAQDPKLSFVSPDRLNPVPILDFSPIEEAIFRMEESIRAYEEARIAFVQSGSSLSLEEKLRLDRILYKSERALTRAEGLPTRPWFKHFIYAPGSYAGYGVKTFPGLREAIEKRKWTEARAQIPILAEVLEEFTTQVKRARELLESAVK